MPLFDRNWPTLCGAESSPQDNARHIFEAVLEGHPLLASRSHIAPGLVAQPDSADDLCAHYEAPSRDRKLIRWHYSVARRKAAGLQLKSSLAAKLTKMSSGRQNGVNDVHQTVRCPQIYGNQLCRILVSSRNGDIAINLSNRQMLIRN